MSTVKLTDVADFCGLWNVTAEAYHADCSRFGKSMLDTFRESPRRFHALYVTKTMCSPRSTPAMEFGSLFHRYVLECDRYLSECFMPPDLAPDGTPWDRRKREHKEAWAAIEQDTRKPVTLETQQILVDMRAAINRHDQAARLVFGDDGPVEHSVWWTDEATSLPLKARRDKVCRGGSLLVDLKTCRDSSPESFARDAVSYGYHRQAAMYLDGHRAVYGTAPIGFVFIAVSKEPPHDVACYELDREAIELGRHEIRQTLTALAECFSTDSWAAQHELQINSISLPKWAFTSDRWEI